MEDPSVDVSTMERNEVLAKLQQSHTTTTPQNINRLKNQLKIKIMESHPIHGWLGQLTQEEVKLLFYSRFIALERKVLYLVSYLT